MANAKFCTQRSGLVLVNTGQEFCWQTLKDPWPTLQKQTGNLKGTFRPYPYMTQAAERAIRCL
ncbi:mask [Symbiodinium microadriaticum]|nr:mask [Symbiodinium microadriaticum]